MIEIQKSSFDLQVNTLGGAANNISAGAKNAEVTGEVPSMKELLKTYQKISETLLAYKHMLSRDAANIGRAGSLIQEKESEIAKTIG